jgi:hypothetical protein
MIAIWCLLRVCGLVSFMGVQYLMRSSICLVSHDYPFYESFVFYVYYLSQMTCEQYVFLVRLCSLDETQSHLSSTWIEWTICIPFDPHIACELLVQLCC